MRWWGWVLGLLAGCGAPPPGAPSAVIELRPGTLCLGDGYATPVEIDGRSSAPRLTLAPSGPDPEGPPLALAWTLSGADHVLIEGDLTAPRLLLRTAADRPLHVELEVRDAEGAVVRALETLTVTLPDPLTGVCAGEGDP